MASTEKIEAVLAEPRNVIVAGIRRAAAGRGPVLAAEALKAGLADECHLIVSPVVVGSGRRSLPSRVRLPLELLEERRFGNGAVYLRYATSS